MARARDHPVWTRGTGVVSRPELPGFGSEARARSGTMYGRSSGEIFYKRLAAPIPEADREVVRTTKAGHSS